MSLVTGCRTATCRLKAYVVCGKCKRVDCGIIGDGHDRTVRYEDIENLSPQATVTFRTWCATHRRWLD